MTNGASVAGKLDCIAKRWMVRTKTTPMKVTHSLQQLVSTVFVQRVEAPALALVEPLLMRGLKEKKIAMKRKVAAID